MKSFKIILIAVSAIYLLSITACRNDRVEVIQGSINAVSKLETSGGPENINYSTHGLVGFDGLLDI